MDSEAARFQGLALSLITASMELLHGRMSTDEFRKLTMHIVNEDTAQDDDLVRIIVMLPAQGAAFAHQLAMTIGRSDEDLLTVWGALSAQARYPPDEEAR